MKKESIEFIKSLANEIKTQDTRGTASPYGLIIGEKKKVMADFDNCDNKAIYWNECHYHTFEEFFESVKEWYLEDCESHKVVDYIQEHCKNIDDIRNYEYKLYRMMDDAPRAYGYNILEVFNPNEYGVNFFLTDKAAKEFMQNNKHNLTNPFSYGIHLYRNKEMKKLIDVILELSDELK